MRANITYSVSMRDIPKEVMRIIKSESVNLDADMYEIQAALEEKNFTEARNKILSAREALRNADIRLHELDQIMASYIEMVNRDTEPQDTELGTPLGPSHEEQSWPEGSGK